jgi:hypothetical protein
LSLRASSKRRWRPFFNEGSRRLAVVEVEGPP